MDTFLDFLIKNDILSNRYASFYPEVMPYTNHFYFCFYTVRVQNLQSFCF